MKQWPLHKAYFWETAPFFRVLMPFSAGIICYNSRLFDELSLQAALAVLAVSTLAYLFFAFRVGFRLSGFLMLHFSFFIAGWLISHCYDLRNNQQWFGNQLQQSEAFMAVVTRSPQEKERTWKLSVSVEGALQQNELAPTTGKAYVYIYKGKRPIDIRNGDTIILPNQWQPIKNSGNPFEFDYANYAARNNLHYQQFLPRGAISLYRNNGPPETPWTAAVHDLSMNILDAHIKDTATLGIMQAILVGDESNFDPDLREAYAETGVIHIIAISGSHIVFFFVAINFLLRWIKKKKLQWIKYAVALPLIWFYVLMAGAPPSAVRAAVMFSLLAAGFMLQRNGNSLNQLFATAFVLLCMQPTWLYSLGFQLSFLAVLGLIIFYTPVYNLLSPKNKILKGIWAAASASIAAELLVAPIVVYYFHIFPLHFVAANVVAYCFMGVILVLGMAIILFHFMAPVATLVAAVATALTSIFNEAIAFFQLLHPQPLRYLQIDAAETLLLYACIGGISVWLIKQRKSALYLGLTAFMAFLTMICIDEWTALHQQRLVVYNLNRSSHIELIEGKKHRIVYTDTTTDEKKKTYVLKPARTVWHAWQATEANHPTGRLKIGRKEVLILHEPPKQWTVEQADYVIVNYAIKPAGLSEIQRHWQPAAIVLSGHISRRRAEELKKMAINTGTNVHATSTDGAYIIEAL